MSLVLYRIDDRLIHGQVVVGWGQPLNVGFIVLVDDEVAGSEWEQELYRMGVPPGLPVYFDATAAAIKSIPKYREDARRGILLTPDIATMHKLTDAGVVESVNVGGLHHRPGRVQRLRYVFLSPEEEAELRAIGGTGVEVFGQDVPGASKVPLDELLTGTA
jgi:PTS system mannose-specific IIB component/fructoselysine and glucoselysine-specific PTS system IIB component